MMRSKLAWKYGALCWILVAGSAGRPAAADEPIQYNRDVRPILAKNCFACHGRDDETRQGELRLDDRQAAIEAGAIVAGAAGDSELTRRIESSDADQVMPPPDSGHRLTAIEKQTLRRWIAQGATYQRHWAFIAPRKAPLPATNNNSWPRLPIDHFVLRRLEEAGMRPSPPAAKAVWIRRVSLDLTGLPPTVAETEAFLADNSPLAYQRVVDRLLESEAYGEHWARMWLDLARYADTKGYEKDRHRDMWRYRDWVINALNRDMPYDQFTVEQLAGDLLEAPSTDQLLATAFHRNTMENDEGGTDNEEFRVAAVKDRVDTTIQIWMGLTMGCAKCHSHKYDPISQRDYYSFYALFNQTEDADRVTPVMPTPTPAQEEQIAALSRELKTLEQKWQSPPERYRDAFEEWQAQFEDEPLWVPARLRAFESMQIVKLGQGEEGTLDVEGELPEKDTWQLTLEIPGGRTITSLRIDTLPKPPGGAWKDKNVVIRELTVEWLVPGQDPQTLKLVHPRADFSQKGWDVARAIDGKPDSGWAVSPQASQPHAAVFDFENPILVGDNQQLRLTVEQQYGQGLVLDQFRISTSSYPTAWLTADIDPVSQKESVFRRQVDAESMQLFAKIEQTRKELQQRQQAVPRTPVMRELVGDKRRETRLHNRGNFLDQGDVVDASMLTELAPLPAGAGLDRHGVALWLMHEDNPLTARVMVNRVWARLFGIGIAETEEDFGTQGLPPSHPELLDWLAVDFRQQGWSLKKLLRGIVLSSTYRQSSAVKQSQIAMDPRNRLLGRGPRFRLSAETIRDQALAVSGLLTRRVGGASVMPPQPGGVWKSTYSGEDWKNAEGPDRYRRGLYTYLKRTSPYPSMVTFDAGSGEVCQIRRVRTNTPLQALVTLNDTVFLEAAGALAARMEAFDGPLDAKLDYGFRRVLVRAPDDAELARLVEFYQQIGPTIEDSAKLLQAAGRTDGDVKFVAVANVLLNLDETLMKP